MAKIKFNIFKCIAAIGGAILLNGIVLTFTTNFNIGNLLTLLLGTVLLLWGIFNQKIKNIIPKWLRIGFIAILVFVIGFVTFLLSYGVSDNINYKEDAIIVLGAAVHGDVPSLVLKDRLDTAVEYHKNNPEAVIVVSGGKGAQETVTEAFAMEKYLVKKGVDKNCIVKEEAATSTYENFLNSKKLLEERFEDGYTVAFISNEYHIYRAKGIAQTAGIKASAHLHCSTRWYSVLPGTLREFLAVMKFWVFKK